MPEPPIRPLLVNACGELATLAAIVERGNVSDQRLDAIGSRGEQLLVDVCATRAISLSDLALKLRTWQRLPPDLWDRDVVIDAAIADLHAWIAEDVDVDCGSKAGGGANED